MKYLSYKNVKNRDELFIENVAIIEIAAAVGTPFYCYSKKTLSENFQNFVDAFAQAKISDYKICYAIKANYNIHLVETLSKLQAGIDAVSAGEVFRAIKAKVDPKKIVFAGVGKTREEIKFALLNGVEEFSVESVAEMYLLNEVASNLNKRAKFSLRVNPNVDAKTHNKISTGRKGDKFGVDIEQAHAVYQKASQLPGLEVYGIAMHIGSQITTIEPFRLAFNKMRQLCLDLRLQGHKISALDFGGGIGIFYKDENTLLINDYVNLIKKITQDLDVKITIAPGRALVGNAGILVTKIILLKETGAKNFAIIDAAMNDLMRPGLYGSYHEVLEVRKKIGTKVVYDLAGPVCETTDILGQNRELINLQPEDLLVFCSAGAYGSSMSNEYNCRPMIPEVLVDGEKFSVIRRRPSFEEMLHLEI
ncbi:MAG: diaminopimelate decarboxylase [Proteobacteria bacterium]|nr:diaminopimelate decarboxylase [Pseudomonadota bacterium]